MTRKTFYQKLRQIKNRFRWYLDDGKIRATPKSKKVAEKVAPYGFCPITAVTFALKEDINLVGGFYDAGLKLDLSYEDIYAIACIADGDEGVNSTSRAALLKSVGLNKKAKAPQA